MRPRAVGPVKVLADHLPLILNLPQSIFLGPRLDPLLSVLKGPACLVAIGVAGEVARDHQVLVQRLSTRVTACGVRA